MDEVTNNDAPVVDEVAADEATTEETTEAAAE